MRERLCRPVLFGVGLLGSSAGLSCSGWLAWAGLLAVGAWKLGLQFGLGLGSKWTTTNKSKNINIIKNET